MLSLLSHSAGLVLHAPLHGNAVAAQRSSAPQMAGPRPVQIIPSVLPADWANMGAECKRLEDAGVDRIQFDVMDGNVRCHLLPRVAAEPPRTLLSCHRCHARSLCPT